jgi:hypothetical protein
MASGKFTHLFLEFFKVFLIIARKFFENLMML